jgi:hypothetical protein
VTVATGTTLTLTGVTVTGLTNLTLGGTTTINGTLSVPAAATFSGGATLASGTTLTLTGVTVTGVTNLTLGGTTTIGGTALAVSVPTNFTANVTMLAGTTLDLTGVNVLGFVPSTPSLTLTPTTPNPGGATTIWANSANANTMMYGSAFVGLAAASTLANSILVATDSRGGYGTAASVINALMPRPMTISSGTFAVDVTALRVSGTNTTSRTLMTLVNTDATSAGTGLQMGDSFAAGTSLTWSINVDSTNSGSNDFAIVKNSGTFTGNVLFIDNTGLAALVNVSSNSVLLPVVASAPVATANTILWSSASSVVRVNTAGNIILVGDVATTANAIPVYTNTTGRVGTASTTTAATLARPIAVTSTSNTAGTFVAAGAEGNIVIGSNGTSPLITFGNTTPYSIGTSGDSMYLSKVGSSSALSINTVGGQLVFATFGFASNRYDINQAASNPGGATTIWSNSADTVQAGNPYWGTFPIFLRTQLLESISTAVVTSTSSIGVQIVWTRLRYYVNMAIANPSPLTATGSQLQFVGGTIPTTYRPTIRNTVFGLGAYAVNGAEQTVPNIVVDTAGGMVIGVDTVAFTLTINTGAQATYCLSTI